MGLVFRTHHHEWFDPFDTVISRIKLQFQFGIFVDMNRVLKLDEILLFVRKRIIEIDASSDPRGFNIPVAYGTCEIIFICYVFETCRLRSFLKIWRSGEFQPEHRGKLINSSRGSICSVSVAFVHKHDKIRERFQIIEIAGSEIFGKLSNLHSF